MLAKEHVAPPPNGRSTSDLNMVEHWKPPEDQRWQAPKPQRAMRIPKVKEPKEVSEANRRKELKTTLLGRVKLMSMSINDRVCEIVSKGKQFHAKLKTNKVAPIHTKVQSRHLELEPLCCLSSCLVRGGCMTVVVFEIFYVVVTCLCVLSGMSKGGFTMWEPLPKSFNGYFGHHIFFYLIAFYDLALFLVALMLIRGILYFDKDLVRIHYYSCFVSLVVNMVFLGFSCWTLSSPGPLGFTFVNCVLIMLFSMQIPLQVWAITVVKSCRDFFSLIHVFVSLADT